MTLGAVEVAVAFFQEYTMSSAEECIPCSPGWVTELITQRAGETGAAGAGNASRSSRGSGDPEKPRPRAMGGVPSLRMRCVQSQRSPVPVWSRGGCVCGPAKPCSSVQRLLTAC